MTTPSHLVRPWLPAAMALAGLACGLSSSSEPSPDRTSIDQVAEGYVKLVLALGRHDADYVDAYYGPPAWREEVETTAWPLSAIAEESARLVEALTGATPASGVEVGAEDELAVLRRAYLDRQLRAVAARVRMLSGETLTFDDESRALYDAVAPRHPESVFARMLEELETELPGSGPLLDRLDRFRSDFVIPPDRLSAVFDRAIAECRDRTLRHLELPPTEAFSVEYVTDQPWSGYNWYQGDYRSLIQVNTDFPITIDRAVDLACHEGYPGHHVYNVLLESHLVRGRGWPEYSVYALFSPQSLIAEGTATYGVAVAFPGRERLDFEERVLFPLAELDPGRAAGYARVRDLVERLAYAGNEAARGYLDGRLDRAGAVDWLTRYALMTPERADQRTRFFDRYRSYVINYNLGRDLVASFVEARRGDDPAGRWREFGQLLASPRLPSGLRVD